MFSLPSRSPKGPSSSPKKFDAGARAEAEHRAVDVAVLRGLAAEGGAEEGRHTLGGGRRAHERAEKESGNDGVSHDGV
jgi:hypothetical protein